MVAQHVSLNLAIQDVASMAAKTCSLGSLCQIFYLTAVQL